MFSLLNKIQWESTIERIVRITPIKHTIMGVLMYYYYYYYIEKYLT